MSDASGARGEDAGAEDTPARVPVGRIGRAHGLDGSFYVTRPRASLLRLGASVSVAGRLAEIERRAGTDKHPILRLQGVADRAGAEALRGAELSVPRAELPALAEGEWWAHELEGCIVTDGELLIGTVKGMLELPSCEVLEVIRADGAEALLVPMVKDAVRRIDTAQRRIEVSSEFLGLVGGPAGADPPADATPA